jgi:hypothetical protein
LFWCPHVPKRKAVTRHCRKLSKDELDDYGPRQISFANRIKDKRHWARSMYGEKEKLKERDCLKDIGVDGKIILKRVQET